MAHEAVELLSRYLKINTANPPGYEADAAAFFAKIFDAEGIAYKTYEPAPGRVSVRGVLPGTGEKRPIVLLNHIDVVPAQADEWSVDPFGGEIKDGFVYGRGALDMKGHGIMELMALLNLKRQGVKLNRDLIFMAVADEETGGHKGAKYLLDNHPEDFKADLVINEGGMGATDMLPDRPVFLIATAEKGTNWYKLICEGPPGHASAPHGNNALERLVHGLSKLLAEPQPVTITPLIAEHFKVLAAGWSFLKPYLEDGNPDTLAEILKQNGLLKNTAHRRRRPQHHQPDHPAIRRKVQHHPEHSEGATGHPAASGTGPGRIRRVHWKRTFRRQYHHRNRGPQGESVRIPS